MLQTSYGDAELREQMVDRQLRSRGIADLRVLRVMGEVPREAFVLEEHRRRAYYDSALPIGEGQTISQPYMVARTLELARLQGDERVLEVGVGSGYQAALLGKLAREVVAVDIVPALVERARSTLASQGMTNVEVLVADGSAGYAPKAPYDCIIVAAGAPIVPTALVDQLAPGGRLVIPVGPRSLQTMRVIEKDAQGGLKETSHDTCVFVPLVGREGWDAS